MHSIYMYAGESVSVKGQPQVGISSPRNFFPLVHFFCHPFIPTVASRASLSFTSILPVPIHTHTHTQPKVLVVYLRRSFFITFAFIPSRHPASSGFSLQ